ncbi:O-antigen ligase family protein [Mucilaginibacter paludis]|uniref:O-antigen ligase-related domain-containing protein n=1 Tax=Mucilaginibacter paludis DSM 18603 TaxID=714943 RepID=H1Y206_9SPHI|nr:O-antigen ligase family protein [Mucilaginibacter paludis]EHQ25709.1 hypothetical protein Mucpa_1551 [Mucilaginibacter paludis DSM 18603]
MHHDAGYIEPPKGNTAQTRKGGVWKDILRNKFSKPSVIAFLLITSLFISFSVVKGGVAMGILFIVALLGIVIVCGVIVYPKFGIATLFISAYLLFIPAKMNINFPLGTLLDLLEYLLIIGFFLKQKIEPNWKVFNDRLSMLILIWILYNFSEIANPSSVSVLAWIYTIRSTAIIILTYFIFVYQIRDVAFIRLMFKIWLFLALIAALDTFHQEFFGFFEFEKNWLYSDSNRVELLFQDGHMRKFSIFADPVSFAYNMVAASCLCIALIFGPIKTYKKWILGAMASFFMFTMLYSGTRGAFPLLPAALILFAVLNYNKKVLIFAIIGGIFFAILIFIPTSNGTIRRFQTAFRPNDDPSFRARKNNQARIKPFIRTHPLGGGLGATGAWGQRFAPGSMLANFPPDSGYVRVAVELGTIGIIILCTLVFVAIRTGINSYYLIKDPELKTYCLAMTLVIFIYNIGNYPQEAIAQFPSNIIFFFAIALINITTRLDREKNLLTAPK